MLPNHPHQFLLFLKDANWCTQISLSYSLPSSHYSTCKSKCWLGIASGCCKSPRDDWMISCHEILRHYSPKHLCYKSKIMKNWVIKKLNSDSYLTRSHFCNSVNSIPLMTKSWLQDAFNKMKSWFTLQLAMKVKHMKPSASSGSVFLRPPQISPKKFTSTQFHEFSPPINLASTSHKYSNMSFMRSGY